jgi:hypothetical protein
MSGIDLPRLQVRLAETESKLSNALFRVDKLEDVVYDLNQKIVQLENLIERKFNDPR